MNGNADVTASRIKALRIQNRLTQKELAKKVGVKPTTVSAWERGATKPTFDRAKVLAQVLHTTPNYLSDTEDSPTDDDMKYVDLKKEPVVLSYDGKPATAEEMDIIKAILERHRKNQ